ncbi:MAG: SDR family NAD(P)-dependent oxidoreductase [Carbonactinosporaceae bacterium]
MPGRQRFEGRVAIVTGGAGGIGRAISAALAGEGAAVAVVDVDARAAEETAAVLRERGTAAQAFGCDVSEPGGVGAMVEGVATALGTPGVLVNAAGGSLGTPRDLADIAPEHLDLVLDVNLKGTFLCAQAVVPYMRDAGGGSIVNVSSIGGRSASPVTGVPYAAAKSGVLGLTRRLAREVGPWRIRVNAVAPGLFLSGPRLSGMWAALSDGERREVLDAIPLGRMPELSEAADPVLYLASDEASYITGAVLDVNGGRFMSG